MKVILFLDAPYLACIEELSNVLAYLSDKEFELVFLEVARGESQAEKEVK